MTPAEVPPGSAWLLGQFTPFLQPCQGKAVAHGFFVPLSYTSCRLQVALGGQNTR